MHHHNFYYGQSHILARYCGLDEVHPPRIRGYLQHGWNVGCGWNPVHEFFDGAWRFVWSERPRQRGYTLGRREYSVIGAPWLYLREMEPDLGTVPDEDREGTLFFLFHGWEGGAITGDHKRMVDEIREVEGDKVTMSLYYTEFDRPEVRKAYLDAGFDVVCFGRRGWNYQGTDRQFLYRQMEALRRHERVASNRLSTAMFYGAAVGCDVGVYGDPMTLDGENPAFGGTARLERLWPEMIGKTTDPEAVAAVTAHELGERWIVPAPELSRLLFDGEQLEVQL